MKASHVITAIIFLIVGAALVYVLRPTQVKFVNGPDDLPVLARGGSMEFFSGNAWTTNTSSSYWTSGVDVTNVSLDGVVPSPFGSNAVEMVTASPTTNWYMSLTFRKHDDGANGDYLLLICTSNTFNPQNNSCSTSGNISNKNSLYLFDAGQSPGQFHMPNSSESTYDGLYRLAYDIPNCPNTADANNPHCNHIKAITATGINFNDAKGNPVAGPFRCRGGACDIGFGQ